MHFFVPLGGAIYSLAIPASFRDGEGVKQTMFEPRNHSKADILESP